MQRLRSPDPRVVAILRMAMLAGTGLLGGVMGWLRSQGAPTAAAENAGALTLVGWIFWAIALGACLLLGTRIRAERDPRRILALSVMGWAFAESVALFGAAMWFLLGTSQWYFAGLGFLALTLFALPGVPRGS